MSPPPPPPPPIIELATALSNIGRILGQDIVQSLCLGSGTTLKHDK